MCRIYTSPLRLSQESDIPTPIEDNNNNTQTELNSGLVTTEYHDDPDIASSINSSTQGNTARLPRRQIEAPVVILERYLVDLDPFGCYTIPCESSCSEGEFSVSHLQTNGLINDVNNCALICLIHSFHRIGLKTHLIDQHFCYTLNCVPDFPSWVLIKILSAMPSDNHFSLFHQYLIKIFT